MAEGVSAIDTAVAVRRERSVGSSVASGAAPSANPADIRHVIILGNPRPESFCHSVAAAYSDAVMACGQQAVVRDLYALGFDALLKASEPPCMPDVPLSPDVSEELALLRDSAVITLIYPLWFGMPPAIIKGYIDRVLGAGFTPRDIVSGQHPSMMSGKRLLSFSTSASTRPWLEEHGQWVSLRQGIDSYLASMFSLVDGGHVHFDAIVDGVPAHYVGECLAQVAERARLVCSVLLSERHAAQTRARMHRLSR